MAEIKLVTDQTVARDYTCADCFFLELDGTCPVLAAPLKGLRFVGSFTVDRDGHHPAKHSSGCSRGVFAVPAAAQDAQA